MDGSSPAPATKDPARATSSLKNVHPLLQLTNQFAFLASRGASQLCSAPFGTAGHVSHYHNGQWTKANSISTSKIITKGHDVQRTVQICCLAYSCGSLAAALDLSQLLNPSHSRGTQPCEDGLSPLWGHRGCGDELRIATATCDPAGHDAFVNPLDLKGDHEQTRFGP
ncbi:uncharacterized protein LOC121095021 [Falco naumanni]|uniref:uncharacterized protein LOC121095021 n=1 Tax=Falco naumanni TaxID=148594 RepID=UPI001ADE10C0|nr:uncharacterized protein LOC121095021 [Falco naumanni]